MRATRIVQKILANYEGETPGVKANLCRMLMNGKLGGSGKMIILPVDQGFEHGPARSFAPNPAGYDPHYHYQLAIDAGLSAYAAPLGPLEAGADTFAGQIPTILKVNSANSLMSGTAGKNQAITASVDDALRWAARPSGLPSTRAAIARSRCSRKSSRCAAKPPPRGLQGHLVLPARRGRHQGRRNRHRCRRLCRAYRGASGRACHQDQAGHRPPDAARGQEGL